MKKILSIIIITLLLNSISVAQKMNIHTNSGTDAYNFADIDSITFDVSIEAETVTDIDGNVYQTVNIGDQWWMTENLKVTHYRNGDAISHVTSTSDWENLSTGGYGYYADNLSSIDTYGCLYNWFAVNDHRNIAPEGWHVPSDAEWKQLEIYLGMTQEIANAEGWRGTDEGGKIKETGTTHWRSPNTGATNESGFSALPAGFRYKGGTYYGLKDWAIIWTASEYTSDFAWHRSLAHDGSKIERNNNWKQVGLSVRCVRD